MENRLAMLMWFSLLMMKESIFTTLGLLKFKQFTSLEMFVILLSIILHHLKGIKIWIGLTRIITHGLTIYLLLEKDSLLSYFLKEEY